MVVVIVVVFVLLSAWWIGLVGHELLEDGDNRAMIQIVKKIIGIQLIEVMVGGKRKKKLRHREGEEVATEVVNFVYFVDFFLLQRGTGRVGRGDKGPSSVQ